MENESRKYANPRIVLYSHDAVGLGHIRRNQAIAFGLAKSFAEPAILMTSGNRQCGLFDLPKCVDVVTIPSIKKDSDGRYVARNPAISYAEAIALRSSILENVLSTFRPDVLIVDKVPLGIGGELEPALRILRREGHTRCVLGLRDILDEPLTVARDWLRDKNDQAIQDYFDHVWVYGDQRVYDQHTEYRFSAAVRTKMRYVGYLNRFEYDNADGAFDESSVETNLVTAPRLVLCTVGGGEDGAMIATAFAATKLPHDMCGIILTGPFMPDATRRQIERVAAANTTMQIVSFVKRPDWLLSRADRVVAMGGYNTVCELLAKERPSLIIPRVYPRQEQLVRARRLEHLGLIDVLHPDDVTSHAIGEWLRGPAPDPRQARKLIDLQGLDRLPQLVDELCNGDRETTQVLSGIPVLSDARDAIMSEVRVRNERKLA